jgi:ketosteroid isomerase-like protein
MLKNDLELVRHGYELWNQRDVDGFFELVDPNVRWTTHGQFPEAGTYVGRDELANLLGLIAEGMDVWIELEDIYEVRDRVVVLCRQHGRFEGHELDLDMPIAHILKVREGKLVEMDVFSERTDALEAIGSAKKGRSNQL